MLAKKIWIPMLSGLLLSMGCGLFSGQQVSKPAPVKNDTPDTVAPVEASNPSSPQEVDVSAVDPQSPLPENLPLAETWETAEPASTDSTRFPALPASAVPENIPEHLRFPPELKHASYSTRPLSPEEARRLEDILKEIVSDYNPRRSRAEVWADFIAAEKAYRAHAALDLGRPLIGTLSGDRYEWQYEQTYRFPEIMECFVAESDPEKVALFVSAFYIAMGDRATNHNVILLEDGREFHMRYNYKYEFKYDAADAVPMTLRAETAYTPGVPRPEVVIDVENTSDAELERLSGWDFRINPITNQPF